LAENPANIRLSGQIDLILIVRPRNKVGEQALRAIVEHPDEPLHSLYFSSSFIAFIKALLPLVPRYNVPRTRRWTRISGRCGLFVFFVAHDYFGLR
jgi:hypothetical protein